MSELNSGGETTRGTRRIRRQRPVSHLGSGISEVPEAPAVDPLKAVLSDPSVPENKRHCARCRNPVGRARHGRPARSSGYCPSCGKHFSYEPRLVVGDLVAGQYRVAGCLAHGGLGWIYLALDTLVSDRWVVLKGLLNNDDPDAMESAVAEKRFLAQVSHPAIVKIYNFVEYGGASYIVMEYVGGHSLKSRITPIDEAGRRRFQPMPVDQALAFCVEVLGAMQYLHDHGLLYCDLKPDNIIQVRGEMRLIDLGAVRQQSDQQSAIFGTLGYQAPEVAEVGPSVASDLFTVGRCLLALTTRVPGFASTYQVSLPPADSAEVLQRHDSFYRLLQRACASEAADRFATAGEMRAQLLGVQREVGAERSGARSALSTRPSTEFNLPGQPSWEGNWRELPVPLTDPADPGSTLIAALAGLEPHARLAQFEHGDPDSTELRLARVRALIELARYDEAVSLANEVLHDHPWDWQPHWWLGVGALVRGDYDDAARHFDVVYGQLPGELAPKLALAWACENNQEVDRAELLYRVCLRTDAGYVAWGAFGLARLAESRGDRDEAAAALAAIPSGSTSHLSAREAAARLRLRGARRIADLQDAAAAAAAARLQPLPSAEFHVALMRRALDLVTGGRPRQGPWEGLASRLRWRPTAEEEAPPDDGELVGYGTREDDVRRGLEKALRDLARLQSDTEARHALIDEANQVRPWTHT